MTKPQKAYAWEKDITDKWKSLKEADVSELYLDEKKKKLQRKEAIDNFNSSIKRKSLIRYMTIIVDFSSASRKQEMRPNRALVIKNYLSSFIMEFFDQNPLSCLSFIATFRERAILLSDFIDSPQDHRDKIAKFSDLEGNASLQNSLELCIENFGAVPSYAKKEVLVIFSSITNCDPGNIFDTFKKLNQKNIQCSVISLSASIHVLHKMCEMTHGEFMLSKDQNHFKDLLKRCLVPKESLDEFQSQQNQQQNILIKMGFPKRVVQNVPTFCACHNELRFFYYTCPNCLTPQCELSSFCKVCQIMLVSAVHLSRTAQHNQSLGQYERFEKYLMLQVAEEPINEEQNMIVDQRNDNNSSNNIDINKFYEIIEFNNQKGIAPFITGRCENLKFKCSGCDKKLEADAKNEDIVVCKVCKKLYCIECDIFIHETLLSCPTCQLMN